MSERTPTKRSLIVSRVLWTRQRQVLLCVLSCLLLLSGTYVFHTTHARAQGEQGFVQALSTNDTIAPAATRDLAANGNGTTPVPTCGTVLLYPMINTIGVTVQSPPLDVDHASLRYRVIGSTNWTVGQDAVRINTGQITGSIFWLTASTSYEVEVIMRTHNGSPFPINLCATTTQADALATSTARKLFVLGSAADGGDGSVSRPFNTIQGAVNVATAGDQVVVDAGVYHENVTFPRSGQPGSYIRVTGQPGAILDGSDIGIQGGGLNWMADQAHPGVYTAQLPHDLHYITGLVHDAIWRDAGLFYEYDSLSDLENSNGHNNVPMTEGWFVDPTAETITVRTAAAPTSYMWHIRFYPYGFDLPEANYVWLEGFTVRYFYYGVFVESGSNNIIQNMSFQSSTGVIVRDTQNVLPEHNRIEANYFTDTPNADWGYLAVKGTAMETGAIVITDGTGTIIRDNRVEEFHDGIVGSGTSEMDLYRNVIRHVADDGFEPDGPGLNYRVWGNAVDGSQSAISLASIDIGPAWVLNNRFTEFTGRAFKIGVADNIIDTGIGFIYQNTVWSDIPNAYGTQQTPDDHDTYIFRNNIFRTKDLAIRWTTPMLGVNMDYDNAFSDGTYAYQWNERMYQLLSDICTDFGNECHGTQVESKLVDPVHGQFGLATDSPNIDTALRIAGINDAFTGAGPDRGYVEFGQPEISW